MKWVAQLGTQGKRKLYKYFDTKEEAHDAYLNAKRENHEFNTL